MLKKIKIDILFLLMFSMFICCFILINKISFTSNKRINVNISNAKAPAQANSEDNIAKGSSFTCNWIIDKDGVLIIWPRIDGLGILSGTKWEEYADKIKEVKFEGNINCSSKCCEGLFANCINLKKVDFNGFDIKNATTMDYMFNGCTSIEEINLDGLNTKNVTSMRYVFNDCKNLKRISLKGDFTTKNVKQMANMFRNCISLTEIDLTNFDTSNVTNMAAMFNHCSSLKELDVSKFNTSNATYMSYMFYYCSSLTHLDVSNFKTNQVIHMEYMFGQCGKLEKLDLSNFDTSLVRSMEAMFTECINLKDLDISNFDTRTSRELDTNQLNINLALMFHNAGLEKIKIGPSFNFYIYTQNSGGASFGRGTWLKEEDGGEYSALEICRKSQYENRATGTYKKLSNMSNELEVDFPVTYTIDSINSISQFVTDRPDVFRKEGELILADIPLAEAVNNGGNYTIPGNVQLLFKNRVTDARKNRYDLKMTIENIKVSNLKALNGVDIISKEIVYIKDNAINLSNYYNNSLINSVANECIYDVTVQILKNGVPVEGSYIFSAYDLDIPSLRDANTQNTPKYTYNNVKRGYGENSEGINLGKGMDVDTLKMAKDTFLRNLGDYHLRGSRIDPASEFTEFLLRADSKESKFQWTGDESCGTVLFSYYQPQFVKIIKKNENGEILSGAKLELYYKNTETLVESWTTTGAEKEFFLLPGEYVLKEVEAPNDYIISEDINFFVDVDYKLTINNINVNNITMIDKKQNTPKYPYTVKYLDKETLEEIKEKKQVNDVSEGTKIYATDEIIPIDKYVYDSADKDELIISPDNNELILYYTRSMEISGFVWLDNPNRVENNYNNVYDSNEDILLSGITVKLCKENEHDIIEQTLTDEHGKYKFSNIISNNQQNVFILFIYNNKKYITVRPSVGSNNNLNSKAVEDVIIKEKLDDRKLTRSNHGIFKRKLFILRTSNN